MSNFDLAIFDIDGTLLDSKEFVFQAYEHTIKTHKLPFLSREILSQNAHPLRETYSMFFPGSDIDLLMETHKKFQLNKLHLVTPFAETVQTLKKLRDAQVKIAALTNRARNSILKTLDSTNITKYFDEIITFEDVTNPKPNPEAIYKLLEQFDIPKTKAVMIGDAVIDVECGKNAGIATIGVTYGFLGKDIAQSDPDFIVDNINEILPIIGV